MARKQVSFRRNGNVVDESPSALSVASEGTAGFLSISQTRMLLSMVEDQSDFSSSTGSADATGSESEIAMPVTTSTSSSTGVGTSTATSIPTESDKLLPEGNESQRSSIGLRQSKKDLMRSLLAEYGLDDDLSSTGDSLSNKSTNDEPDGHPHNNNDKDNENDTKSEKFEIDSRSKDSTQKFPAEKSETTCETALDDSDHDHDQESLQLQAGPLQPTSTRQTPKKSIGSPRSRSQSSPSLPRNDCIEDRSEPDLEQIAAAQVRKQTSTPQNPASKRQIRTNSRTSSLSSGFQDDDTSTRSTQPVSTRSAYETDPFASPMSTDSSDFHLRKLDSDIDNELVEAIMDIPLAPHGGNNGKAGGWEAQKNYNLRSPRPTTQPKSQDSDEDSPISISSDEGFLDRAVRRRPNRLSIQRKSTGATRTSSNRWKVKVPTGKNSFGSKSKARKSAKTKSTTSNQGIPVTETPKLEQMEIDDNSSVESPLSEEALRDEFFEEPIEENPVEIKQHGALDSDSEDISPIVSIKPRITERQPEVALLSEPFDTFCEDAVEEKLVETKLHEAHDIDSGVSKIGLNKPPITEPLPQLVLHGEPFDEFYVESIEENPVETKQDDAQVSDSDDHSPTALIRPGTTERPPEEKVVELEEVKLKPKIETKIASTTNNSVSARQEMDMMLKDVESPTRKGVSKAHDPVEEVVVELDEVKLKPDNESKLASTTNTFVSASIEMDVTPKDVKFQTKTRFPKADDPLEEVVMELEEVKVQPDNESKIASTTNNFVSASKEVDMPTGNVNSQTISRVSKAHDPPEAVELEESKLKPENEAKVASTTNDSVSTRKEMDMTPKNVRSPSMKTVAEAHDRSEREVVELVKGKVKAEKETKVASTTNNFVSTSKGMDRTRKNVKSASMKTVAKAHDQPQENLVELKEGKLKPENEAKVASTTNNSALTSNETDLTPKHVKSQTLKRISQAHDPPGVHGTFEPNGNPTTPKISSSKISKEPSAKSTKLQAQDKRTVPQKVKEGQREELAKRESKTNPKKPKRENATDVKSTKTPSGVSEETYEDTIVPLSDEIKRLPEKASKTRQKTKETKTKPTSNVKSKKAKSSVDVKKMDPEPDHLPPFELSYRRSQRDDERSPHPTGSSSMRSIDADGIWRPPSKIPGLHGSAADLNSPERSTSSQGSDDQNFTQVEWKSVKAPFAKTERHNADTLEGSSRPQTPDITSDMPKIREKSPAAANQFSTVELNPITLSGNRSEASNRDYQGTPGSNKRNGRLLQWPKGNRNEATRRLSNESFEGGSVPSRSVLERLNNENFELEKTPKAAKSRTFLWPTIPRLASLDKNLSAASETTQQTMSLDDAKKMQSPRIPAKSLPESYPSLQYADRQINEPTDPPLDVPTTPKKPKSSSWLPWARKSPKMKYTPPSPENKPTRETENPMSVNVSSRQDQSRPLSTPPFGLLSNQRRPMGRESSSVAEQREGRRAAYIMDQQRRQAIKIQAATRGYLSRKKFPRARQRAKPPPKVTQMVTLDQTREAVIERSQSPSTQEKSQGEASDRKLGLPSQRNMKPALHSYQHHEESNEGKSVAEQREARRLAYQQDQQRRSSIVIQSALRGYIVRKNFGLHEPQNKKSSPLKPQEPLESFDQTTLPFSHESGRNQRANDDQEHLLVAPKTPEPVTPKKSLRWLPWARKRDENSVPRFMDKNPQTSELTNVQRFDASLYLRRRMYQDEQESHAKSLDEIREARRQMYLRDLERREVIKIQSVARGYLLRKKLSPSSFKPITRKHSEVKSTDRGKSTRSMIPAKSKSEQRIDGSETFDRSVYLRERLERDEAERRTKSVAEVRLERQQIYLRDLQRREATRIQAAWRGHQVRQRYPGFAKTYPKKCQPVNQTISTETTGATISKKTQDDGDKNDENSKQTNWMKRFFFGKSKEAPSEKNLPVVDEQEPEYEPFDPYADTDDFFGFSDPKYKERTGFFALNKPKRTYFDVQAVSEDARHWTGRKKQGSNDDFDKAAYLKERKAREEFEKQSASLTRKNAARREAAQKDIERRGALRIQAVARGYIARKKNPLPKTKRLKESPNAKEPTLTQRSKRLVTKEGTGVPPAQVARTTSKRMKKKEKRPSAHQGNRSPSSVVKDAQNGAIPSEKGSTRQLVENSMQRRGSSTKALKKEPSKVVSTSRKEQATGSVRHVQQGEVSGEKNLEVASDSKILSEEWSEEIVEEVVLEGEQFLQGASTALENVAPKKLSTLGANLVRQGSGESCSNDSAVNSSEAITTQVGDFDQTDNWNRPRVHSGSTYSTDVGENWWLPSIGTDDTRTYRQEIYVPDTDMSKYYRRPAPKISTTTYWEAVRTSYLPSVIDGQVAPVIVPPVVPFSETRSVSTKIDDLGATSSVHSEESWLPPQQGDIARTTIPHGSTDVDEPEPEGSWVPPPSKPQLNAKRVDYAGTVQKGESFRWAPHLPSPSKRENKPRIEVLLGGDVGGDSLICNVEEPVDIEQGTLPPPQNMARTSRTKNRRIMTCILFFFVLLVGGGTAAYFLWDDPPWEKWLN